MEIFTIDNNSDIKDFCKSYRFKITKKEFTTKYKYYTSKEYTETKKAFIKEVK